MLLLTKNIRHISGSVSTSLDKQLVEVKDLIVSTDHNGACSLIDILSSVFFW